MFDFRKAGYVVGFFGTIALGSIATYCVHMLVNLQYELCKWKKVNYIEFSFIQFIFCTHMHSKSHKQTNKRKLVDLFEFQVPSMSYPSIAEAAFLCGPKRFQRYAPIMEYVHSFAIQIEPNIFLFLFVFIYIIPFFSPVLFLFLFFSRFAIFYFRHVINICLLVYQIGGSCIYVVFMATNLKALLDAVGIVYDVRLVMLIILLPLILINWVCLNFYHFISICEIISMKLK